MYYRVGQRLFAPRTVLRFPTVPSVPNTITPNYAQPLRPIEALIQYVSCEYATGVGSQAQWLPLGFRQLPANYTSVDVARLSCEILKLTTTFMPDNTWTRCTIVSPSGGKQVEYPTRLGDRRAQCKQFGFW